MRKLIDMQMKIGEVDISKIEFDLRSRDEIPKLLMGLQGIFCNLEIREKVQNHPPEAQDFLIHNPDRCNSQISLRLNIQSNSQSHILHNNIAYCYAFDFGKIYIAVRFYQTFFLLPNLNILYNR